jgi:hypothetical protein
MKEQNDTNNGTATNYQIVYLKFAATPILTELNIEDAVSKFISLSLWSEDEKTRLNMTYKFIPDFNTTSNILAFNISSPESDLLKGEKVKVNVSETYSFITKDSKGVYYGLKSAELEIELETWRTPKEQKQYEKEVSYNETEAAAEEQA